MDHNLYIVCLCAHTKKNEPVNLKFNRVRNDRTVTYMCKQGCYGKKKIRNTAAFEHLPNTLSFVCGEECAKTPSTTRPCVKYRFAGRLDSEFLT